MLCDVCMSEGESQCNGRFFNTKGQHYKTDNAVLTVDLHHGRDRHNHHGQVTIHQQMKIEERDISDN